MKPAENVTVVALAAQDPAANDPPALVMPAHFEKRSAAGKQLKAAWDDLVGSVDPELLTKANLFTFEFAATLMAKFRGGTPMTATETKELKRHLIALGLAKADDDDAGQGKKKGALSKYIR